MRDREMECAGEMCGRWGRGERLYHNPVRFPTLGSIKDVSFKECSIKRSPESPSRTDATIARKASLNSAGPLWFAFANFHMQMASSFLGSTFHRIDAIQGQGEDEVVSGACLVILLPVDPKRTSSCVQASPGWLLPALLSVCACVNGCEQV